MHIHAVIWSCIALLSLCGGCGTDTSPKRVTLTLGAFTVAREAYRKEIIPAFQRLWKEKTGQHISFRESYVASGAQSRAIQAGFEADIAALSLENDITALVRSGMVRHDWKHASTHGSGFVSRSVVVIAYRPGNPKNIRSLDDLTRPDVTVVCPDPKTSGGARWFLAAIYGAGLTRSSTTDHATARALLAGVQKRVTAMDTSGRMSVTTFEQGIGDALVTYESEALLRKSRGNDFPFMIPNETILIENPVALVDVWVDKHGTRAAAEAFIDFLYTKEAQRTFARYGFRPVNDAVATETREAYPVPPRLFDIGELGGWEHVSTQLFGPGGIWTQITAPPAADRSQPAPDTGPRSEPPQ